MLRRPGIAADRGHGQLGGTWLSPGTPGLCTPGLAGTPGPPLGVRRMRPAAVRAAAGKGPQHHTVHPCLRPARLLGAINKGRAADARRAVFIEQHLISAVQGAGPRPCYRTALQAAAVSARGMQKFKGFGSKRCFWGGGGTVLPPPSPGPRTLLPCVVKSSSLLQNPSHDREGSSSEERGDGCFSPLWDRFGMGTRPVAKRRLPHVEFLVH